jgi:hypothetical protein
MLEALHYEAERIRQAERAPQQSGDWIEFGIFVVVIAVAIIAAVVIVRSL